MKLVDHLPFNIVDDGFLNGWENKDSDMSWLKWGVKLIGRKVGGSEWLRSLTGDREPRRTSKGPLGDGLFAT